MSGGVVVAARAGGATIADPVVGSAALVPRGSTAVCGKGLVAASLAGALTAGMLPTTVPDERDDAMVGVVTREGCAMICSATFTAKI